MSTHHDAGIGNRWLFYASTCAVLCEVQEKTTALRLASIKARPFMTDRHPPACHSPMGHGTTRSGTSQAFLTFSAARSVFSCTFSAASFTAPAACLTLPLIVSVVFLMAVLLVVLVPLGLPTCLVPCLGAVPNQYARVGRFPHGTPVPFPLFCLSQSLRSKKDATLLPCGANTWAMRVHAEGTWRARGWALTHLAHRYGAPLSF